MIKISKKRKNYTNENLDITIIEITEKDEINDFLELDDEIINNIKLDSQQIEYYNRYYINQSIYILNYLNGDKIMVSYGLINDIKENQINHNCNTDQGSSGVPILSLENLKLIGVHYGASNKLNFNKGSLIILAITEFYKMISERLIAIERIKDEIQFILDHPFLDIGVNIELPREEKIFEWKGFLIGPDDTPYKGGIFCFKIEFPVNYPNKAPKFIYLTPIYHLNVCHYNDSCSSDGPLGNISNCFIPQIYKNIRELLIKLYAIFYLNNLDASYGKDRADEFKENPQLFEKKAKYFTKKYANINNASNTYKVWDFIYNEDEDKNNDCINITFEFDGINRQNFQVKKKRKN